VHVAAMRRFTEVRVHERRGRLGDLSAPLVRGFRRREHLGQVGAHLELRGRSVDPHAERDVVDVRLEEVVVELDGGGVARRHAIERLFDDERVGREDLEGGWGHVGDTSGDMPGTRRQGHVRDTSGTRQGHVRDTTGTRQGHVLGAYARSLRRQACYMHMHTFVSLAGRVCGRGVSDGREGQQLLAS